MKPNREDFGTKNVGKLGAAVEVGAPGFVR
jgi:hypothetical protein